MTRHISSHLRAKVVSRTEAATLASRARASGQVVVFTNGVFDLLHPGHVRYLQAARREGNLLIVGLNSDRSVRAIKGPSRPINSQDERAEVLAALSAVDAVVIFDEPDPQQLIDALLPNILVKGADWPADGIVGRETVEAHGGRVIRIPLAPGHSSSAIIEKIQTS